jgi:hypothetical protein
MMGFANDADFSMYASIRGSKEGITGCLNEDI